MKNDRVNYVLVGAFVLAMVAGLVLAVAALTGRTGATDAYFTRFEDATGLKYGTQVLYMGFPVGQVESIRPVADGGGLLFELELAISADFAGWNVPRDSVAQVRAAGLLAAITLDIRAGTSSESLAPGDRIRSAGRVDVMAAMADTANTLRELTLTSLEPLLENLNRYVTSVGGVLEQRAAPLIDNLSALSEVLAGRAPGVIDDFLETTQGLRRVSMRLEEALSDDNAAKVGVVVDNVLAASDDLARLTANARTQLGILLGDESMARAVRVLSNADDAAQRIAAASASTGERLERLLSPDNLGRVERALVDLEQASDGARQLLGPARMAQVDDAVASAGSAARELEAMVSETRVQLRALLSPQTARRFDTALANVSDAAANLARLSERVDRRLDTLLTPEVMKKLERTLENFSLAAANVARLTRGLDRSREDLEALLTTLRGVADDNRGDVRAMLRELRYSLEVVSQHIDAVAQDLEGSSRNMLEFSRRLKANPGLLLRGGGPPPGPEEAAAGG